MSAIPTKSSVKSRVLGIINKAEDPMSREELAAALYPNINRKAHLVAITLQGQVYDAISELEAEHRLIMNGESPPRLVATSRGKESYKDS
jgi:hypothetical protein